MNEKNMMEFIESFMVENNWDNNNVPEQSRALFTAWCFMFRVDADTSKCDKALNDLYFRAALEEQIKYDEFESFMLKLIV